MGMWCFQTEHSMKGMTVKINQTDLSTETTLRLLSHFTDIPFRSVTISITPDFYQQAADEIKGLKQNIAFLQERIAYLEGDPNWKSDSEF